MGRVRTKRATNAADQDLQWHLNKASRELREALAVCGRVSRRRNADATPETKGKAQRNMVVLQKALGLIEAIGSLVVPRSRDRDLLPEEEKKPRQEEPERFDQIWYEEGES